jgi:hypothetical protein
MKQAHLAIKQFELKKEREDVTRPLCHNDFRGIFFIRKSFRYQTGGKPPFQEEDKQMF